MIFACVKLPRTIFPFQPDGAGLFVSLDGVSFACINCEPDEKDDGDDRLAYKRAVFDFIQAGHTTVSFDALFGLGAEFWSDHPDFHVALGCELMDAMHDKARTVQGTGPT